MRPGVQVSPLLPLRSVSETITFAALAAKTYGDAAFTVSASASSGLAVSFAASGNCTVSGATVTITGAGSCTITASQAGDANYNAATSVPQLFTIAKAPLTITASSPADILYGAAAPTVTASFSGFVAGDDAGDLGGTLTCGTAYTAGNPVGPYTTSCSGATSSNYDITYAGGSFDVTPAPLTITASSPADILYGAAAPTVTASYAGFVLDQTAAVLTTAPTCSTTYTA
ncbi:MAG: MBG domain-containing protein, partial [Tepidiformaceae bacterium]